MSDESNEKTCLCGSAAPYEQCCAPYHAGEPAPTALALMRSRYCAYAMGKVDYIIGTTHRDNPEYRKNTRAWRSEVLGYCKTTTFLGLTILEDEPGEEISTITFQAKLRVKGSPVLMTEKSRFVKPGKRWLYHSGN